MRIKAAQQFWLCVGQLPIVRCNYRNKPRNSRIIRLTGTWNECMSILYAKRKDRVDAMANGEWPDGTCASTTWQINARHWWPGQFKSVFVLVECGTHSMRNRNWKRELANLPSCIHPNCASNCLNDRWDYSTVRTIWQLHAKCCASIRDSAPPPINSVNHFRMLPKQKGHKSNFQSDIGSWFLREKEIFLWEITFCIAGIRYWWFTGHILLAAE